MTVLPRVVILREALGFYPVPNILITRKGTLEPMSDLPGTWVKSSFCADTTCVEVSTSSGDILVRDGKHEDQPFLRFAPAEWDDFLDGIVAGHFRFT
jgi:hypothetical protein